VAKSPKAAHCGPALRFPELPHPGNGPLPARHPRTRCRSWPPCPTTWRRTCKRDPPRGSRRGAAARPRIERAGDPRPRRPPPRGTGHPALGSPRVTAGRSDPLGRVDLWCVRWDGHHDLRSCIRLWIPVVVGVSPLHANQRASAPALPGTDGRLDEPRHSARAPPGRVPVRDRRREGVAGGARDGGLTRQPAPGGAQPARPGGGPGGCDGHGRAWRLERPDRCR